MKYQTRHRADLSCDRVFRDSKVQALAQPAAQGVRGRRNQRNCRTCTPVGRYSKQQCYDLQGEINYFTANQQRMDYPLYRSCGLPIGISSRGGLQERGPPSA